MAKVSLIGCGAVGSAWAVVFAKAGHDVVLFDANTDLIETFSLPLIRETLDLLARSGAVIETVSMIMGRISSAQTLEDAACEAEYVQESISERLELKRSVFQEIAGHAKPDAILASSTSALKGSTFLSEIINPERALVAHPVNPPSLIPLVELCGTPLTSPDTITKTETFLTAAGMKPIRVNKEIDGFILNRLQYTLVAEAMHLVGEGYCSASDIDRVMTDGLALRWASIGPFETAHLNAHGGFADYVAKLGPMMRKMGADAKTDYEWTEDMVQAIHEEMCAQTPVDKIPARQHWRNVQILAARAMQNKGV